MACISTVKVIAILSSSSWSSSFPFSFQALVLHCPGRLPHSAHWSDSEKNTCCYHHCCRCFPSLLLDVLVVFCQNWNVIRSKLSPPIMQYSADSCLAHLSCNQLFHHWHQVKTIFLIVFFKNVWLCLNANLKRRRSVKNFCCDNQIQFSYL